MMIKHTLHSAAHPVIAMLKDRRIMSVLDNNLLGNGKPFYRPVSVNVRTKLQARINRFLFASEGSWRQSLLINIQRYLRKGLSSGDH